MINFWTKEEATRYFEERGFHFYKDAFADECVCASYQKKYTDKDGVRYFIDADIWCWTQFRVDHAPYPAALKGQYYAAGTHDAINMEFLNWSIEDVERWLDKQFDAGLLEHYESND